MAQKVSDNPFGDWSDKFYEKFIMQESEVSDDLLFFVLKEPTEKEKYCVFRRDSSSLPPRGEPSIDWEHSHHLNMIINQFRYNLSVQILYRKSTTNNYSSVSTNKKDLPKIEKQVWASPSRIRMDVKTSDVEQTYPQIFFGVNDFQNAIQDIVIDEEDQLVCVRLIAYKQEAIEKGNSNKNGNVIFSGAIGFPVVRNAYAVEKKGKNGWWPLNSTKNKDVFLNMKGPGGNGEAQMAVRPSQCGEKETKGAAKKSSSPSWGLKRFQKKLLLQGEEEEGTTAKKENSSIIRAFNCALTSITLDSNHLYRELIK